MAAIIVRDAEKHFTLKFEGGSKAGGEIGGSSKSSLERYAKKNGYSKIKYLDGREKELRAKPFDPFGK